MGISIYIYVCVCVSVSVCVDRKLADVDINGSLGGVGWVESIKSRM